MTKNVVFCAVILFLITASIAEDMTPDDALQALKDQNKNISQAIPSIVEAVVSDDEDVSQPEEYDYEYEDEEDDPENPITVSPNLDESKAILEAKTPQNTTQTDAMEIVPRSETAISLDKDDKKEITTKAENVTEDADPDKIFVTITGSINEGIKKDTLAATKTEDIDEDDVKDTVAETKIEDIDEDSAIDTVAETKAEDIDENGVKKFTSLDTPPENSKESEKKEPLTPSEIAADFDEKASDLEELAVIPIPKVKVEPRIVSRMINITINTEEFEPFFSVNFPKPYPDEEVKYEYTVGFGPGFGVEMIVKTIDFEAEDYLLIRPGGVLSSERQILFTYFLKTEKKYKLLHLDELYIEFVTHEKSEPNTHIGFDIDFKRVGEVITTTTPEPTEPPPVTVAPLNESALFLGGKTAKQFLNNAEEFRVELATIAELYCNEKNITIDENITISDNVNYNLITRCNIDWPDSVRCVEVRYSIGVHFDNETGTYEMTVEHMNEMWEKYARLINLTRWGLVVFYPPNDQGIFWLWLGISLGIIGVFMVVLLMMWKYRFFYQYVQTPSQRESLVQDRKSNLSLFPTPHQSVPPLYGHDTYDDRVWMDTDPPRYSGEELPSYGGGQVNQGYERNEDFQNLYSHDLVFYLPEDQKEQADFGTLTEDENTDNGESNS